MALTSSTSPIAGTAETAESIESPSGQASRGHRRRGAFHLLELCVQGNLLTNDRSGRVDRQLARMAGVATNTQAVGAPRSSASAHFEEIRPILRAPNRFWPEIPETENTAPETLILCGLASDICANRPSLTGSVGSRCAIHSQWPRNCRPGPDRGLRSPRTGGVRRTSPRPKRNNTQPPKTKAATVTARGGDR